MSENLILPNFVIAGAPKCGSTALFEYLKGHPQICPASKKETYYLIDDGYPLFDKDFNYKKNGLTGYAEYFAHCRCQDKSIFMEATPDYLYQKTPLQVLTKFNFMPKIVIILRKPSKRIFSMFQFAQNNMATINKNITFNEYLNMLENNDSYLDTRKLLKNAFEQSHYEKYIDEWVAAFGIDNVKIIIFEDMISNIKNTMLDITEFLGIDSSYYNDYVFTKSNETYMVRFQFMHRIMKKYNNNLRYGVIRKLLKKVYYAFNLQFGKNKISSDIQKKLDGIDKEFISTYDALESKYNLDLSVWR